MSRHLALNKIGAKERTRGSETSQYPQEKKSNETLLVAASERGRAQTVRIRPGGVVGLAQGMGIRQENTVGKPGQSG